VNSQPVSALPKEAYRLTKIIFTLGPATENEQTLEQLILAGVDVCRLNMAHANHAWTRTMIRRVREVCQRTGRHIALLMDVKGPEIRTGDLSAPVAHGGFQIRRGAFTLAGKRLDFARGNITFSGGVIPQLDFAAQSTASAVTAQILITGPANQPEFAFT